MATIMIPTPLRKFADNKSSVEVDATQVADSLILLSSQYPDFGKQIFETNGQLQGFLKIFVGEDDIDTLEGIETRLNKRSIVSIIPAIAGG